MGSKEYKIAVVNSILDNVHGFIGLTQVENQIERLPIFKRLQNISQLGLSHRIFPCALHNRYVHSLGVMYIADQMAISLSCFNDNERQLLRLAGMLHDIGHYPLSHDIENVYKECQSINISSDDLSNHFINFRQNTIKSVKKLKRQRSVKDKKLVGLSDHDCHHENMGVVVLKHSSKIKKIIEEYYVKNNEFYDDISDPVERIIEEISAIITGNAQYKMSLFPEKFSIMIQLLHSEIDADRIDYLLRDATFSGASYGTFDLGMLIRTLSIGEYKGTKIVGVNLKGIGCAEQFLINRYLAYNQVINHKYTSIIGCVLQAIVTWLILDTNTSYNYRDVFKMIKEHELDSDKAYLYFTDNYLMSFINSLNENNKSYPEDIRILLNCLKQYQAFDMLSEEVVVDDNVEKIASALKESDIYQRMMECDETNIDKIYQYREIVLTKHVPLKTFKSMLKGAKIKDEADKIPYYIDRLLDGAAIIEEGKEPYLLVDSPRSMLHHLNGIRYSILREYDFERFRL